MIEVLGVVLMGGSLLFALLLLGIFVVTPQPRKKLPSECKFLDIHSGNGAERDFPSLLAQPTSSNKAKGELQQVELTVVVPAFREVDRLPGMLDRTLQFLRSSSEFSSSFEIIVVDDGSQDETSQCALEYAEKRKCREIRVMTLQINRGKGGAVTQGVLAARGKLILFADADGATDFNDFPKLVAKIKSDGFDIAVGSRAHLVKTSAVVQRSAIRNFLMHSFHLVVSFLASEGVRNIKDTQCGFKLFTRRAAQLIFPNMHIEGWIFDVELLHLAYLQKLKVAEVPVNWTEVEGSKMSLLRDSIKMAIDLLTIRLMYTFGLWRIRQLRR